MDPMKFKHEPIDLGYTDLVCDTPTEGPRTYETAKGNNKYPSITSVLSLQSKAAIQAWRKRVGEEEANKISRRASSRGTKVNQIAEDYVNNIPLNEMDLPPTLLYNFMPIKKILDSSLGLILGQELPLYSDYLKIAGRVDLVAYFNGKLSIIDYKTSAKPKKKEWCESYFIQETFYAIAFEERTKIPITQLVTIIAVDGQDDPTIYIEHRDDWDKDLIRCIKEYNENN
jgi:genome maintenance exonuclease 1